MEEDDDSEDSAPDSAPDSSLDFPESITSWRVRKPMRWFSGRIVFSPMPRMLAAAASVEAVFSSLLCSTCSTISYESGWSMGMAVSLMPSMGGMLVLVNTVLVFADV